MRRIVGVLAGTALAVLLARAAVPAAEPFSGPVRFDFASALMLRLFGETTDASFSFAAENGNRIGESPLRNLALQVRPAAPATAAGIALDAPAERFALAALPAPAEADLDLAVGAGVLSTALHFSPPAARPAAVDALSESEPSYTSADYEPVEPLPRISPEPGTLAFVDSTPGQEARGEGAQTPIALDLPQPGVKHALDFSLSGAYQQLMPNDAVALEPPAASAWQLSESNAPVVPNLPGANHLSLGAALALPVFRGLTLGLNYDAQRSYGADPVPGLSSLDAANNLYAGRLTYALPSLSSTLSISAYQNRSGQSVLPNGLYAQTGEDVNFTVKF